MKINLSQRTKDLIKGFVAVMVIVLFTWAAVSIANSQYQNNIEQINERAKERQAELKEKIDSANKASVRLEFRIQSIKNDMQELNSNQINLQNTYNSNYNELKKIQKDEKIHIPAATPSEQLDFLSNYRYIPID